MATWDSLGTRLYKGEPGNKGAGESLRTRLQGKTREQCYSGEPGNWATGYPL